MCCKRQCILRMTCTILPISLFNVIVPAPRQSYDFPNKNITWIHPGTIMNSQQTNKHQSLCIFMGRCRWSFYIPQNSGCTDNFWQNFFVQNINHNSWHTCEIPKELDTRLAFCHAMVYFIQTLRNWLTGTVIHRSYYKTCINEAPLKTTE